MLEQLGPEGRGFKSHPLLQVPPCITQTGNGSESDDDVVVAHMAVLDVGVVQCQNVRFTINEPTTALAIPSGAYG